MSSKQLLTTSLVAFAAGATIALFAAPCMESASRKKIRKFASRHKETLSALLLEGMDMLNKLRESSRGASSAQ